MNAYGVSFDFNVGMSVNGSR